MFKLIVIHHTADIFYFWVRGYVVSESQNIIKYLEARYAALNEELRVVRAALSAARSAAKANLPPANNTPAFSWKNEVANIISQQPPEHIITLNAMVEIFQNQGIKAAFSSTGRSALNTTLVRMVKAGQLEKIDNGIFKIKQGSNPEELDP